MFLGHSVTQRKNVSDATAKVIDEEIRRIVDEGEQTAREILTAHLDELHALAKGLLEYETLSADEIRRIIKGERIVREHRRPVAVGRRARRAGAARCRPRAGRAGSASSPSRSRAADRNCVSRLPATVQRYSRRQIGSNLR